MGAGGEKRPSQAALLIDCRRALFGMPLTRWTCLLSRRELGNVSGCVVFVCV